MSKNLLRTVFINRDYGLLFMGRLVSGLGDGIHYFALAWLVLDLTGSGAALGSLLMVSLLPSIFLTPFTGVLADTLDRKKIVVSMDIIRGVIMLAMAIIYMVGRLNLPVLYLGTVLLSICSVLFGPAISATIPNLVSREELVQANARDGISRSATGILGPIMGALLLGWMGYGGVFLFNGISFLLSAFSEMFIRFPKATVRADQGGGEFFASFKSGLRFVWGHAGLRSVIGFALALNFVGNPLFGVVFPFFGKEVLGMEPQHYGLAQSSFPAGLLLGTLLVGVLSLRYGKHRLLSGGILGQGVLTCLIGILAIPWVYTALSPLLILICLAIPVFFIGVLNIQVNVPLQVMLQETVPDHFRGRVYGLLDSLVQLFVPISMALFGVLLDLIPTVYFLVICGAVTVALGLSMSMSVTLMGLFQTTPQISVSPDSLAEASQG